MKLYTGTNQHDGHEVKMDAPRKMTMHDIMNMSRKQRRAMGKKYGVKIPGIQDKTPDQIKKEKLRGPDNSFMKPDAKVENVLDIK